MAIPPIASYAIPAIPAMASNHPRHRASEMNRPWSLDPSRTALLVHDMQRYFLRPFTLDQSPAKDAIAHTARLIALADELGLPVFYTAQPPRQEATRRGLLTDFWGEGLQDDHEAEVIDDLAPKSGHHMVTKWRYSAFNRTDLLEALNYAHRDQLLITGVYAHMGCKVTAVDAFMADIQPFMINDAIADFTAEDHADTTSWVQRRCGSVIDTETAIAELRAQQGGHHAKTA